MADIGDDKPATAVPESLTDAQAERYIAIHFENYGYSWIAPCQFWRYDSSDQAWIVSWIKPE